MTGMGRPWDDKYMFKVLSRQRGSDLTETYYSLTLDRAKRLKKESRLISVTRYVKDKEIEV